MGEKCGFAVYFFEKICLSGGKSVFLEGIFLKKYICGLFWRINLQNGVWFPFFY